MYIYIWSVRQCVSRHSAEFRRRQRDSGQEFPRGAGMPLWAYHQTQGHAATAALVRTGAREQACWMES